MRRVWSGVVPAGVVLAGILLTACGSPGPGRGSPDPARTSSPTAVPVPAVPAASTDVCLPPSAGRSARVTTVAPDPVSVSVVWYPGLNRARCREPVTTGGAALAARLAHDVRTAVTYAPGVYNCPADLGQAARLTFAYPDRVAQVTVTLTGCMSVRIPGDRRWLQGGQVASDLAAITPPDLRPR